MTANGCFSSEADVTLTAAADDRLDTLKHRLHFSICEILEIVSLLLVCGSLKCLKVEGCFTRIKYTIAV